jgi:hypothetical protein
MRRILGLFTVAALLVTLAAPVAADTTQPVSGTYKSFSSYSLDCVPDGAGTTCTQTSADVFTETPPMVVVCVNVTTYAYSEESGPGDWIGEEGGCTDPIAGSALTVSVLRDQMTARLAPTDVTLFECGEETCTETRTVTVSASDSGGPVEASKSRSSYKDGACKFRYSESSLFAQVAGTLTIDGTTMAEEGYGQLSQVKVQEKCN